MSTKPLFTEESQESFEDACSKLAEKFGGNSADELIEFEISSFSYRQGGFAGIPPTYIVSTAGPQNLDR